MPLVPNFTATQTLGDPSSIDLEDTSTGSDAAIASRRVYRRKADGTFIVESGVGTEYDLWPLPLATGISLDGLDKDYALDVIVQYLDSGGNILYSKSILYGFTLYNETFDYGLTQLLPGNPLLINDNDFFSNKSDLRVEIDSGNQAIEQASDIYGAQQCYDRATALRISSQYFFNGNS